MGTSGSKAVLSTHLRLSLRPPLRKLKLAKYHHVLAEGKRREEDGTERNCTLWKSDRSPACRAVMMALDAMHLNMKEIDINMDKYEHKSPEMSAMNPLQTLPILRDRDMIINDSHTICTYLASRYCAKEPSLRLYPADYSGRALVNFQMYYNCGVLYPRYRAAADPLFFKNSKFVMPQQVFDIECAYGDMEKMLGTRTWFGGITPTFGDIFIGSTVSTLHALVPIDPDRFPLLGGWLCRLSEQFFYLTGNKKGLYDFIRKIGEITHTEA